MGSQGGGVWWHIHCRVDFGKRKVNFILYFIHLWVCFSPFRKAMGHMGRNYTVGNVFDWQGIHVKGGGLNWVAGEMGVRYINKYWIIKYMMEIKQNSWTIFAFSLQTSLCCGVGEQEQRVWRSPEASWGHNCGGGGGICQVHLCCGECCSSDLSAQPRLLGVVKKI